MIRANYGNMVANASQTLSVAGTTAAGLKRRSIADASSALNNLTPEERSQYGAMQANKIRDEISQYNNLSQDEHKELGIAKSNEQKEYIRQSKNKINPLEHLSDEEQQKYGERRTEDLLSYINKKGDEDDDVDSIMENNSPQTEELSVKIVGDIKYYQRMVAQNIKTGMFVSTKNLDKKENDKNANV